MGRYKVEDEPDLTIPEDTIVRARLDKADEKTIEWVDKKTGDTKSADLVEWYFKVLSGEYEGVVVKGSCTAKLTNHPANRFRAWAEGLLGRTLDPGMELDLDDLVGLQADVSVRHKPDKQDPKKVWVEVDEVMSVQSYDEVPF